MTGILTAQPRNLWNSRTQDSYQRTHGNLVVRRRSFFFCAHILLLLLFSNFFTVFYFYFLCVFCLLEIEDCYERSSAATNIHIFQKRGLKSCQKNTNSVKSYLGSKSFLWLKNDTMIFVFTKKPRKSRAKKNKSYKTGEYV